MARVSTQSRTRERAGGRSTCVRRDVRACYPDGDANPMHNSQARPGAGTQSIRRQDQRFPVRIAALVHCHGRFQTVRLVDFSLTGLQLEGCFGVGVGENIAVELLSGHRLDAKVAWSMGSRIGVRFAEPISPQHPVLLGLKRAARGALEHGGHVLPFSPKQ